MVSPGFQYLIELLLHMLHNIASQRQYICLSFGSNIGTDRTLDGADQSLHQVFFVNKFEGNVFNGLFGLVQH